MMFRFSSAGVILTAPSANLASLVEVMSRFTERPVVDMTGIEGQYVLSLTFAPETNHSEHGWSPRAGWHPNILRSGSLCF